MDKIRFEPEGNVTLLPRGGYLVHTPVGEIQFGVPPETIKDTMVLEHSVPRIFVLPRKLFNWQKGINVGDMEFPIYFNFFLKKQKTFIVCRKDQARSLLGALQEAVFGPAEVDISGDIHGSFSDYIPPDISAEMAYFRKGIGFKDLFGFCFFRNGEYRIRDVSIREEEGRFSVSAGGRLIALVPDTVEYKPKYDIGERLAEPYKPPLFGVTCLGPSHGFDPKENTSGYIIWLNHSGIMIDPPVDSTEWLQDSNVNPKLIDSIILTHCHADHDAGTFQKILEEGKITIYTTYTVMESFLRKYSALSGEPPDNLRQLFQFQPICIGRPVFIHGGEFSFEYRLHSIPTIGFTLRFQDQTFVYSSDHQGDPAVQREMLEAGIITPERHAELAAFPWESDVIYHESGIPPLHTPISFLNSLDPEVQKRIVVYHIAAKDFPRETDLTLATFGIENTLYYSTIPPDYEETYQILNVLKSLDFFDTLTLSKVQSFVTVIEKEHYGKGDVIIRNGHKGDKFYIITSGNVAVKADDLLSDKILGAREYFGEVALLTGQPRTADITAATDVDLYAIRKEKFLSFIADTEFERILNRLIMNRSPETWNILVGNPSYSFLTTFQKTWLESIMVLHEAEGKNTIAEEGYPLDAFYIILDGTVAVSRRGIAMVTLGRGDFIGSLRRISHGQPAEMTYSHDGPVRLFRAGRDDIRDFLTVNPGIGMKLVYDFY